MVGAFTTGANDGDIDRCPLDDSVMATPGRRWRPAA